MPIGARTRRDTSHVSEWGVLSGNRLNYRRKSAEDQFFELNLGACIIDIDANQIAAGVVIKHHTLRNLTTLDTRLF